MNVVLYMRYSSDRQTEQSIEGQQRVCTAYCESQGMKIVGMYIDRALSASKNIDKRTEFQRMIRDSEKHFFEAVVVYKLDRFARNRYDSATYKAILRKNGVRVISATEGIGDDIESIILESVLEGMAEYFSKELSQKVTRGMRESALKCQYNGSGLSLGYSVDKAHHYHIDESGADIVRSIFQMYDGGAKMAEIVRSLNAKQIRSAKDKPFSVQAISRILRNRQYIGEYRWKDIVKPGGVPRIIDDELFERVQKRMAKNKTIPAAGRGEEDFLLTGKVYCGHCGSTITGDSGTSKSGNKFYYYSCRNKKIHRSCKKKSVKKDWLEREVTRLTVERILQTPTIEYIAERVVSLQEKERKSDSELSYYTDRLRETNNAIANLMKAIEAGIITESTKSRLMDLEEEKGNLEIAIAKVKASHVILTKEQVVYYIAQFKHGDIEDKAYQASIIDMLVQKVVLYDDKFIITYNFTGDDDHPSSTVSEIEQAAAMVANMCSDIMTAGTPSGELPQT